MVTFCDENFVCSGFASSSTDDRRFSKHIHDNVHGNIYLDSVLPLILRIFIFMFKSFCNCLSYVFLVSFYFFLFLIVFEVEKFASDENLGSLE